MTTVLDVMDELLAENNLDIALAQMKAVVSTKQEQITDYRKYVSKLKRLARYIHMHTRDDNVPYETVEKDIIPLVDKAASRVVWKGEYFDYARSVLQEKVVNLGRYCKGLDCIQTF